MLLISLGVFPNMVYAQIPVSVVSAPIGDAQRIINIIKEYGLDTLANSLAQIAGAKLSNKIVNKSTGGASGDSSQNGFIDSFADYFGNLDNQQIDKFVTDLGISKSPYAAGIAKTLIGSTQDLAGGKSALEAFDLDRVIGQDWEGFAEDASVGGWDGFLAMSNPANTKIGAALLANEEVSKNIKKAKELEQIKLQSPGTKPQGKCNKSFSDYKGDINKQRERINNIKKNKEQIAGINKTQNDISNQAAAQGNQAQGGNSNNNINNNPDILGDGPTPDLPDAPEDTSGDLDQIKKDLKKDQVALGGDIVKGLIEDYGGCLEEFINNPVGTSTSMLTSALDAGAKQLSAGDEIGEMIAGMVLGLVNSFIKGGLTALNADFKPSRSSVGGPEQLVGVNGQTINWTQIPNTIIDLQEEFPSAMTSTRYELSLLKQYSQTVARDGSDGNDFSDRIIALDACVPGPDFRYNARLDIYKKAQLSKLERLKNKGKDDNKKWRQAVYDDINTSVDYAKTEMEMMTQRPEMNIPGASVMQSQISVLKKVRNTFQQNQKDIVSKQLTINILSQIESILKSSVRGLNAADPTIAVPVDIAFTDHNWEMLSRAQQDTFVVWAKKLYKMPTKTPLFGSEWDTLTVADKKIVVDWAKQMQGLDAIPTGTTEKDLVLGSAWLVAGVDPQNIDTTETCDESCTVRKNVALGAIWSLWVNPERYITNLTEWTSGNTTYDRFIKDKSSALTLYNSIKNDISIPYTIQKIEVALKEVTSSIDQLNKLTADCKKMKDIIQQNSGLENDPNGHTKMLDILKARKTEFASSEVRDAITNYTSILSLPIGAYQADPLNNCGAVADPRLNPLYGQDPNGEDSPSEQEVDSLTRDREIRDYWRNELANFFARSNSQVCKQEIGIVGDVNDNDEPTDPGLARIAEEYQIQPAKSVWELLRQGDQAMCGLNKFVRAYAYPPYSSKGYKPVLCDTTPSGWMTLSKKTIVSYMFSENIVD